MTLYVRKRVIWFLLFSMYSVLLFSSEKIHPIATEMGIEWLLVCSLSGSSVAFNVAVGMFVSALTYTMLSEYPRQKKLAVVRPVMRRELSEITSLFSRVISKTLSYETTIQDKISPTRSEVKLAMEKITNYKAETILTHDCGKLSYCKFCHNHYWRATDALGSFVIRYGEYLSAEDFSILTHPYVNDDRQLEIMFSGLHNGKNLSEWHEPMYLFIQWRNKLINISGKLNSKSKKLH